MAPAQITAQERLILRARAVDEVSCDAAFEQLYALYAPVVRAWLLLRVRVGEVDDLCQDVWVVFYHRWRGWEFLPEMEQAEARPVISFLYRTAHFVLEGHRRSARSHQSLEEVEASDEAQGLAALSERVEVSRCLALARRICTAGELDVLLARLADIPAREIARTLSVTEAAVDHRYRRAIARLQKRLLLEERRSGKSS